MSTASISTHKAAGQVHYPERFSARASYLLATLVLFWLAIYLPGLFRPALLDDADTVHAEAAREMLTRHDWVTLHADGVRYLEKAPLQYWAVATSYKLFGISEWSTRLPLSLGVLALAIVLFQLGSRIYGKESGFYSALVILTAFGPYIFTRFFIPDVLVGLWLTIGFGFFLTGLRQAQPSRFVCWGLAASAALNVLTKGLIGIVFPVAILGVYLLVTRNLRYLLRMRLLSSAVVFLVIAAPWHILAALRNPAQGQSKGFLWFYFVNEHFKRYLGTRYPKDYDTVPLLLFWGLLLIWLLPWSAFLPQAIAQVKIFRRDVARNVSSESFRRSVSLLLGIWAAVILIFFSFSTRQEYYVLPALPALALLLGSWLVREGQAVGNEKIQRSGRISSFALLVVGVLAFVSTTILVLLSKQHAPGYDIADLLRHNPSRYALSFGHFFDLTPQALGAFRAPLLGAGISLLIGTGVSWMLRRRRRYFAGNIALGVMMIGLLWSSQRGFALFEPVMSSKELALAVEKQYRPGDVIVINGEYEQGSTMNFYTGKPVHVLKWTHNLWYGSLFPDAPPVFESSASFQRLWNSSTRVFLWTQTYKTPSNLLSGNVYQVASRGDKAILSNQPNR